MKNLIMFAKNYSLPTGLILPVACLVAFTGCSSIEGTAGGRASLNTRVATYMQTNQERQANPIDDTDADPGYEWFY